MVHLISLKNKNNYLLVHYCRSINTRDRRGRRRDSTKKGNEADSLGSSSWFDDGVAGTAQI
jgi:hypothetical protein